ncbi:GNAT family N-acetyltransferase [Actibacterium ureilyticum]|uniref:GNAT family N-acetyltransferase n=1 Tax=Actibacterium ureilyticum TaxID=1590614 RepID=UPI000BAA9CCC|nr:GNAT family N-acetyltransferase [Actibacterium ureilyticum]
MTEALVTRRAGPEDMPACARIVHDWVQQTDWMPKRFTLADFEEMFAEALPMREIYVVGKPVAGYLSFDPETARIIGLYTAARGRGLGKALVDRVKCGRDFACLHTHGPNTRAHRFYRREGFVPVEQIAEGDDGLPELRMEWRREVAA